MSFVMTDEFSVGVMKVTSRIGVSRTQPIFLFLTYLNLMNDGHIIKRMQSRYF